MEYPLLSNTPPSLHLCISTPPFSKKRQRYELVKEAKEAEERSSTLASFTVEKYRLTLFNLVGKTPEIRQKVVKLQVGKRQPAHLQV